MKKHEFFVRERLPVPPIVLELLQQIPVVLKFANVYDAPTSRKTELYSALCTSWTGHAFLEDLVDDVLDPDFLGVEGLQLANETTDEVYGIVVVRKRDERLIIEALGTVQKSGWPLGTILLATTLHLAFHFHNYAIVKLATRFDTRAYYMYQRMGFVVTYEERNVVDMQLGNGNLSDETLRRLVEDRSFSNAQTDVIFFPTGAPVKTDWSHKTEPLQTKPYDRPKFLDVVKRPTFDPFWNSKSMVYPAQNIRKVMSMYHFKSPVGTTGALFRRRSDALGGSFFSGEEFNIPFTDLEHYAVSNLNVNNGADGLVLKRFTEPLNDISLLTRNWLDHEDVMVARPRLDKTATFYERTYLYLDDAPLISTDNARLQKYMRKVLDGGVYDGIVVYTDYEERRPVGLLIVRWERDDATMHIKLLKINSGSVGLGVAKLLFRALLYTAKLKQTRYILVTVDQFAGVTRVFDRLGFVRRTVSSVPAGHASYALELSTIPTHYLFSHEFDAAMYHT